MPKIDTFITAETLTSSQPQPSTSPTPPREDSKRPGRKSDPVRAMEEAFEKDDEINVPQWIVWSAVPLWLTYRAATQFLNRKKD